MVMATTSSKNIWAIFEILVIGALSSAAAEPALFESHQLTPSGEYTFGIEGPAVDATGTLYVVNIRNKARSAR
jgi:signal peptidase